MVYNSWLAMQAAGETDPNACAYNDFALVKLDPADVGKVDPTVPGFGGPTGVGSAAVGGTRLLVRQLVAAPGDHAAEPEAGRSSCSSPAAAGAGRSTRVTPGIPGDSGSGFMNASGQAIGVLSTLAVLPLPLSNGVGDLSRELAYARSHGVAGVQLVNGTKPFSGNLVTAILGGGGGLLAAGSDVRSARRTTAVSRRRARVCSDCVDLPAVTVRGDPAQAVRALPIWVQPSSAYAARKIIGGRFTWPLAS